VRRNIDVIIRQRGGKSTILKVLKVSYNARFRVSEDTNILYEEEKMFVIANLLIALASILRIVIVFFEFCIIVSALLSFIMPFQYNRFRGFVDSVTNIILNHN